MGMLVGLFTMALLSQSATVFAYTLEELVNNAKEAIDLYVETLKKDEKTDLLQQRVVGIQKVKVLA